MAKLAVAALALDPEDREGLLCRKVVALHQETDGDADGPAAEKRLSKLLVLLTQGRERGGSGQGDREVAGQLVAIHRLPCSAGQCGDILHLLHQTDDSPVVENRGV